MIFFNKHISRLHGFKLFQNAILKIGLIRGSNTGPPAPKAGIIPLDQ